MPDLADLRNEVERMHSGKAIFVQSVPVREKEADGKVVWNGLVRVFEIHTPVSIRVYAGSLPVEGGLKRRIFALRHTDKINSPVAAVRAAIAMEDRRKRPIL